MRVDTSDGGSHLYVHGVVHVHVHAMRVVHVDESVNGGVGVAFDGVHVDVDIA